MAKNHIAATQMKRLAKKHGHSNKELAKDIDFLNRTDVSAFVWLSRPNGTHLFPVDYVDNRTDWRTIFCRLHTVHTDNGEPIIGHIFQGGKLKQASIRQCHNFLTLHNGQGIRQ